MKKYNYVVWPAVVRGPKSLATPELDHDHEAFQIKIYHMITGVGIQTANCTKLKWNEESFQASV